MKIIEGFHLQYKLSYPWCMKTVNDFFLDKESAESFIKNELSKMPNVFKPYGVDIDHYALMNVLLVEHNEKYYSLGESVSVEKKSHIT